MIVKNNCNTSLYKNKVPTFSGPRLSHQTFEEFQKFSKETNFLQNFKYIITPQNLIGQGHENEVYKIPGNDVFLLRKPKDGRFSNLKQMLPDFYNNLRITRAKDMFPNHNMGQAVAKIGLDLSVIIKQEGTPNGIQNWTDVYWRDNFPQKQIPEFVKKLEILTQMGQQAYNNFAEEVKVIVNKKHAFFDFVNPGNVLVHPEKQNFNIVDVGFEEEEVKELLKKNSTNCMLGSLLDERNFMKVFNSADAEQKKDIKSAAKEIRDKVQTAAKEKSLSNDEVFHNKILEEADNEFDTDLASNHKALIGFLNNL